MFLDVTNNQQAQQSMLGVFANAQNVLVTGGSFTVVSLIVASVNLVLILCTEQCQYSPS